MAHTIQIHVWPSGLYRGPLIHIDPGISPLRAPQSPEEQVFGWNSETDPREIREQFRRAIQAWYAWIDSLPRPEKKET